MDVLERWSTGIVAEKPDVVAGHLTTSANSVNEELGIFYIHFPPLVSPHFTTSGVHPDANYFRNDRNKNALQHTCRHQIRTFLIHERATCMFLTRISLGTSQIRRTSAERRVSFIQDVERHT